MFVLDLSFNKTTSLQSISFEKFGLAWKCYVSFLYCKLFREEMKRIKQKTLPMPVQETCPADAEHSSCVKDFCNVF